MRALSAVSLMIATGCGAPYAAGAPGTAGAGGAAINAVAAAALWATAGGCRLQGCPYGSYCDNKSGFCESHRCSEGCPEGTVCNEGLDRCQMAGPGNMPNDRLPQDDKIRNPPLSH